MDGYFVLAKHAVVTFFLEGFPLDQRGISNTRIDYFHDQNVLSSASIKKIPSGYELVLEGCFGVDGSIVCERMSVRLQPSSPGGNVASGLKPTGGGPHR